MVSSKALPTLERHPGGPDNWVEAAGGLPPFIDGIAKHLVYERGFTISHAIATARNAVKRWKRMGKVAKHGDPNNKHVTAKTAAKAAEADLEWETKRKAGKINLTAAEFAVIDLTSVSEDYAIELAEELVDVIDLAGETCVICKKPATKKVIWADGRAFQPSCDADVKAVQDMLTKKNGKMTELAGVQDLSDADISDTSTMVALMLPQEIAQKVAVEEGTPPEDMHITITFNGDTDDDEYEALVADLEGWAKDCPTPMDLKGSIGGIGTFPATDSEQGQPWYIPVDIPGLNTLHEQVKAVADRSAPASEDHGYTPHVTLTYQQPEEGAPEPVDSTPVDFHSIWVVRGNDTRTEIPLGPETSAAETDRATLPAVNLAGESVDLQALAERAGGIEDPIARAAARARILELAGFPSEGKIDLASTIAPRNARGRATDGRRSYKGQGKWKHGFVPANGAAKEAKAKGSPIAIKRLNRLFGKSSQPDDARQSTREVENTATAVKQVAKKSATPIPKGAPAAKKAAPGAPPRPAKKAAPPAKGGRAGNRSQGAVHKNNPVGKVKVDEKGSPAESANSVGFLRNQGSSNKNVSPTKDNTLPSSQMEASKATRVPKRARQNWDEIPSNLKTERNGKRYVLAEFGGKGYLTEWVGGVQKVSDTPLNKRKVMRTLSSADAADMSSGQLRDLINNPRSSAAVRTVARKALRGMGKSA